MVGPAQALLAGAHIGVRAGLLRPYFISADSALRLERAS